jgi:hypothetical protein
MDQWQQDDQRLRQTDDWRWYEEPNPHPFR